MFYEKLNRLLDESGFDTFVEELCEPYCANRTMRPMWVGTRFRRAATFGCCSWDISRRLTANGAMKSIVRKETGEDWKEYVKRLAEAEGVEIQSDEDLRKYDKTHKNKKVSNAEWESKTDHDSRIMKMKDGRTHLAYKAEHTIDLESEFLLDATVYHGDEVDTATLTDAACKQTAASVCKRNAASWLNGASLTCAKQAEQDAVGCVALKRSTSDTKW